MVHQYRALLVIEFSIHARVPDEIHDPLLPFILIQAQASRKIPIIRLVDDPQETLAYITIEERT